jgi:hypothetical protein
VSKDWKAEAVRGYNSERKKMLGMWDRQQRSRQPKKYAERGK